MQPVWMYHERRHPALIAFPKFKASFTLVKLVSFTETTFEFLRCYEMKLAMNWDAESRKP